MGLGEEAGKVGTGQSVGLRKAGTCLTTGTEEVWGGVTGGAQQWLREARLVRPGPSFPRPLLCWGWGARTQALSMWGGEQVGLVSTWEQGIQDTGGDCQPVKELSGERQGELQAGGQLGQRLREGEGSAELGH